MGMASFLLYSQKTTQFNASHTFNARMVKIYQIAGSRNAFDPFINSVIFADVILY